ncbi:hypothetical protein H6G76_24110 [Nostoc sp. FACHB-152]|uniref:hypothetical protein n=1 Tax=unclassified Nostoc TaxID=2593658 RepID=UPI0016861074|nr:MULTISPECIES: hypothetical protein [unclassified Nostoc]MBD2450188.1 hypothetical protein [Nostoc sp. FACHB-152]MBD2469011.1 hypothetical protein [Nostoc sp. FACHB-145]
MLRVYHLFLLVVLLLLAPLGYKLFFSKEEPKNPVTQTTPKPSPQISPGVASTSIEGNIWQKILNKNSTVPNGWQIAPCQGNQPLLCVSSKGEVLGTVEIRVDQVSKDPKFQKHLTEAGIPFGTQPDYKNSSNQTKVLTALKAWATDYYQSLLKDRQKGYGNKIVFSTHPFEEVSVGKLPGIRYGFTGIKQEGGLQEQYISHAAYDGKVIYVISTSFDPGAATGKFEKLENFLIFQPYYDAIAENLNL